MKHQSWEAKQLDRLRAELTSKGNTKEAWVEICDLHDLPAMQAGELAAQCGLRLEAEPRREAFKAIPPPASPPARVMSPRKFTPLKKTT